MSRASLESPYLLRMPHVSGMEWNWTSLRNAWTMLRYLSQHNDTSPHATETMASVVAPIVDQLYVERYPVWTLAGGNDDCRSINRRSGIHPMEGWDCETEGKPSENTKRRRTGSHGPGPPFHKLVGFGILDDA